MWASIRQQQPSQTDVNMSDRITYSLQEGSQGCIQQLRPAAKCAWLVSVELHLALRVCALSLLAAVIVRLGQQRMQPCHEDGSALAGQSMQPDNMQGHCWWQATLQGLLWQGESTHDSTGVSTGKNLKR